jgi:DNA-binding NarL/FixJ family response regulator
MTEQAKVRVLVVDDSRPFRIAARQVLRRVSGFAVVGEAECCEEALERVAELAPDLVLMDIKMPGITGVEAARRISESAPQVVVFLCSTYDLADLPAKVGVDGVAAYVHKEELRPELLAQLWEQHAPA